MVRQIELALVGAITAERPLVGRQRLAHHIARTAAIDRQRGHAEQDIGTAHGLGHVLHRLYLRRHRRAREGRAHDRREHHRLKLPHHPAPAFSTGGRRTRAVADDIIMTGVRRYASVSPFRTTG